MHRRNVARDLIGSILDAGGGLPRSGRQSPDRRLERVPRVLLAALLCAVAAMPCLAQGAFGKSQLIWFSPRNHGPEADSAQAIDYMDLFNANAPWTQAASHVQIFKFYNTQFLGGPYALTDDQLRQALADLKRRQILLAVETGILTDPADGHCGNVEGFYGEQTLDLANRIKALGGTLDYLAVDGGLRSGLGSCNWTPQQSAENAAQNIAMLRTVFPSVKVGDIETPPNTHVPDSLTQLAAWLDAWQAATGEPLAFLHADDSSSPIPALDAMRQIAEQRQIPFGIIYDGLGSDASDSDWVDHARGHYESIETAGNVIPDHVVFQSWHHYPKHVLPESDPTTFTHLIDTYFRTRTAVSAALSAGEVSGKLLDDQLNPVAGAPISVTAEPISGSGIIATYTLTGTVPAPSTQAVIHFCVNTRCSEGAVGTNDMSVYSFAYSDSGNQTMLDFGNGLQDWYLEATGSVRAISDANGAGIQISATPDQYVYVSSAFFTVTPGSNYVLTVRARVSPSSVGSGKFALIFLAGGIETTRATLPFSPAKVVVGTTQTTGDGTYSLPSAPPGADQFRIQAAFQGDDSRWPATAIASSPTVSAIEYYYAAWDYYFETAFPQEIAALDGGAFGGVWQRTGQTFRVWPQPNASASPTCRFFSTTFAPKSSHFFSPLANECALLSSSPDWQFEAIAFYVVLADANGLCPAGTVPLYRLYNNGMGGAPNHRYTTSLEVFNAMLAAGWVFEGNDITKVFACVPYQ